MTHDPSAPGATFALGDICWIDFESRSSTPITAGTDRYSRDADAVILCWAIGAERVFIESVNRFPDRLKWSAMPTPLKRFFDQVYDGKGAFCAHNAGFDRAIWNHATEDFPHMEPWMMIDSRAQAAASGLPPALADAAKKSGGTLKDDAGKHLIKLFCLPDSTATPWSHSVEWQAFADYAARDVAAMRDLFLHTRQLPWAEWEHYWTSEAINERGIGVDVPLVEAATRMAAEDAKRSAQELAELTGGAVTSVNQVQRLIVWLSSVLPATGRTILVERIEEQDENGEITKPEKTALTRKHVERLLAYLESLGPLPAPLVAAQRALQIRLYGGSKTPAKFGRMVGSHVDGIIRNQYVFNGASQTGRYCLAEGSLITVRTNGVIGEKPIERVNVTDEVWDGESWVVHDGVVFSGGKEVIEHDGVIATPEHIVYLNTNYRISLGEAKALGSPIWQGEIDVSDLQTDKPVRSFLRRHNVDENV